MNRAPATGKREPVVMALVLTALTCLALRPSIRGVDGAGNYVYLMSIMKDGDLDFSNDYAAFDHERGTSYHLTDAPISAATGRPANRYGIGSAIFWAPAVLAVHGVLTFLAPDLATGLSPPYAWAVGVSSAWWGCLGVWLLFMRVREQFGSYAAWLTAVGILLATPLSFYVWAHGSMSHAVSFFIAVVAMLSLEKALEVGSVPSALFAGLWAGLLILTRVQDATWVIALGVTLVTFWQQNRASSSADGSEKSAAPRKINRWIAGALFGAAVMLVMSLQMGVWNYLYGSWFSGPLPYLGHEGGRLSFLPAHLWGTLFAERRGAFSWHPILFIALIGLVAARRSISPPLRLAALGGIALQIYLISCWSMWWGGASFGNRFFISSYPFLALGIAFIATAARERGRAWLAPILLSLLIIWNCALLYQYGTEMISRENENGWALVIKNQFTEVPRDTVSRLGGLLHR